MHVLNISQRKLVAQFFATMAVVWFTAAFIEPKSITLIITGLLTGFFSLLLGIFVLKEVD